MNVSANRFELESHGAPTSAFLAISGELASTAAAATLATTFQPPSRFEARMARNSTTTGIRSSKVSLARKPSPKKAPASQALRQAPAPVQSLSVSFASAHKEAAVRSQPMPSRKNGHEKR